MAPAMRVVGVNSDGRILNRVRFSAGVAQVLDTASVAGEVASSRTTTHAAHRDRREERQCDPESS